MKFYGLDKLVSPDLVAQNPAALDQDLFAVKEVLRQYAGGLQALYKYYDSLVRGKGCSQASEVLTK